MTQNHIHTFLKRCRRFLRSKHGWIAVSAVLLICCMATLVAIDKLTAAALVGAVLISGLAILIIDEHKTSRLTLRAVVRADLSRVGANIERLQASSDRLAAGIGELAIAQQISLETQTVTRDQLLARDDLLAAELRSLSRGVTRASDAVARDVVEAGRAVEKLRRDVSSQSEATRRDQGQAAENLISEIDALLQVARHLPLDAAAPLTGGWAISPRGLLQLIDLIVSERPRLIVECGPGTTTVYAAAALRSLGLESSRIVGLEHQPGYADQTRRALSKHGLDQIAEIRVAPLTEWHVDGAVYSWYSPDALDALNEIDLLIVDGPPRATGHWARYPAFPALRDHLRERAYLLVDDAKRVDEREIVAAWMDSGALERVTSMSSDQALLVFTADRNEKPKQTSPDNDEP